jgi:DNA-binding response OmpR family regulator
MHVLLIEDHEPNAQSYLRMLQEAGYATVHWVQDGITGLEAGVTDKYDAIIIDLDLPGLDGMHVGLALYRQMQAGHVPATPLIALTARTDTATRDEAARLGFGAWIGKPCTAADLIETLRQVARAG